jgi:DNA-binding NtrC family response regulator
MSTPSGKRPILVVDDELDILQSLKGLLRRDFEVHTANSGAEAITVLEEHPIHVVMTDQRMPQMTGVEFLRRIKTDHPEAIRVIFTGYADIQAVVDAVNQGNVFRYVAKPWNPEELIDALREAGEVYDRLAERERLLADLREHEQRCVTFDDEMRSTGEASVDPATAARLRELFGEGRALLARLGSTLSPPATARSKSADSEA